MKARRTICASATKMPRSQAPSPALEREQMRRRAVTQHRSGIVALCNGYGIEWLEVFGQGARASGFGLTRSTAMLMNQLLENSWAK